jgi:hypothetical protein
MLMGYIFAFHLPTPFVTFLGTGWYFSFLRGANSSGYEKGSGEYKAEECLASTLGPSVEECKTTIPAVNGVNGDHAANEGSRGGMYGASVLQRAKSPETAFMNLTGVYRDGVGWKPWAKSLETITDLYALETSASESSSPGRRRSSISSNSVLAAHYKGALRAPTYVLWGLKDQACGRDVCLDGIGDYLSRDSEVTLLPKTGHWTPVQKNSRPALATAISLYTAKDAKPIPKMTTEVQKVYESASLLVKK